MKTPFSNRLLYFLLGALAASVLSFDFHVTAFDPPEEKLGVMYLQTVDSDTGLPVEINYYEDPRTYDPTVKDNLPDTPKQYAHFAEGSRHFICFIGTQPVRVCFGATGYENVTTFIPTVTYQSNSSRVENALVKIKMTKNPTKP